ncbi:MAG: hypothetical protein K6F44_01855 [Lachnospiraceae bacterium]|nr:hypothetical protein [Lachnospiraceae bacterium]
MGLSAALSGLSNLGNSVLGNPSKGALLIRRMEEPDFSLEGLTSLDTVGLATLTSTTATALVSALASGGPMRGSVLRNFVDNHDNWDLFEFQYNPETIYLNSQAGSYVQRQGAPENGINQVTMSSVPAQTAMSFRLMFYDINNAEAFLQDKMILSASAVIKDIMALASTYSVQTPIDGLVSLVNSFATRQAVFVMGEVVFFGEIESVNAQYTMFSPSGNPIAAVVDISIRQTNASPEGEKGSEIMSMGNKYWDDAFTKLLGKPGKEQKVNSKSLAETVGGSLLNLNA